jgi:hypothetical protein
MVSQRAVVMMVTTLLGVGLASMSSVVRAEPEQGAAATEPGNWAAQKYTFNYMGFTTTYSCTGLEDKLRTLLSVNGAGPDKKHVSVVSPCERGAGVPDKLVFAVLSFSTLKPGQSADVPALVGQWKHVELTPHHPYDLGSGDCELIEQFRDRLLPMFSTRNVVNRVSCTPHQADGSNYLLSYDVFVPPPVQAAPPPRS